MKYTYNQTYNPPMPVLTIRLSTPELGLYTEVVEAIVDTGADGTIVPEKYLRQIQATKEGRAKLSSPLGAAKIVHLYLVDIEFGDRTLSGIWVVGDETGNEVVLGRNVLNRMQLLLNGLSESSEILYL